MECKTRDQNCLLFSVLTLFLTLMLPGHAEADCIDYGKYIHWVGSITTPPYPLKITMSGTHGYVSSYSPGYITVLDLSNPVSPTIVGSVSPMDHVTDMEVSGAHLYAAGIKLGGPIGHYGLQVMDISNPTSPTAQGFAEIIPGDFPEAPKAITMSGNLAYLAAGPAGLWIIDVSNPLAPIVVGSVAIQGNAYDVVLVSDSIAYVAVNSALRIIDVSNPSSPQILGSLYLTTYWTETLAVSGTTVYVGDGIAGLLVIDASNPTSPAIVGSTLGTSSYVRAEAIAVSGTHVVVVSSYGTDDSNNLVVLDVSDPSSPTVVGKMRGGSGPRNVTLLGPLAFVSNQSSREIQIIDISRYVSPPPVAIMDTDNWGHAVAVSGNRAYCISISYHTQPQIFCVLQVVDISNPAAPVVLGKVNTSGIGNHVAVSGTNAYVVDGDLQVIDASNPASPAILATVITPGVAEDVIVSGSYAYIADSNTGLQVVKLTQPHALSIVGAMDTPGSAKGIALSGSTVFLADGGGLQIISVSNPESPFILGSLALPDTATGVAVFGTTAYVSGNKAGLRMIDVSNPAAPQLLGSIDTPGRARDIAVSFPNAYVADQEGGVQVIDVFYPASPVLRGGLLPPRLPTNNSRPSYPMDLVISGSLVYVADQATILAILPTDCAGPTAVLPPDPRTPIGALRPSFPNPVLQGSSNISFSLSQAGMVKLRILDLSGREVRIIAQGRMAAGDQMASWDGRDGHGVIVPAGIYLYQLQAPGFEATRKLVRLR